MALKTKHKAEQVVRWIERATETPTPNEVLAYVSGKWPGLTADQRRSIAIIAMGIIHANDL